MSPRNPLASFDELESTQVAGRPMVAFCRKGYPEHHAWLTAIFGKDANLSVTAECNTVDSMLMMLETNAGLAVVQEGFERLASGRVVARPLKNADEFAFSFGVSRKSGVRNVVVDRFFELAKAASSFYQSQPAVTAGNLKFVR